MENDLIRLAAERAARRFGGTDGIFNSAGFSQEFTRMARVSRPLDGNVVRAMLCGRSDCELLSGGAHFRLVSKLP